METFRNDQVIAEVETDREALSPVATQLTEALRQMQRSFDPFLRRLKEWSDAAAPYLKAFDEWNRKVDTLNEVGWLPYGSASLLRGEECGDDLALLDIRLSDYYRDRWKEIRDDMESRLAGYHIDDEARETFREALLAHEARLYRCVCRVLFPEIERMIGAGRGGSEQMLKDLTETRDLADFAFRERFGYVLFVRLVNHAYKQVAEGEREKFERDPVPNRHAAMHGLVPYSTHKNSMNMLILTNYAFSVLPPMDDSERS